MTRYVTTRGVFAGQAVVQMVRSIHNGLEYAIKFFVSRDAFNVEHALYEQGTGPTATGLAQFLPEVCHPLFKLGCDVATAGDVTR
jgi:hypothetical protein